MSPTRHGDLDSNGVGLNNPTVAAIQGIEISATPPSTGQVLVATGAATAEWQTISAGGSYVDLSSPQTVGGAKTFTAGVAVTSVAAAGPQLIAIDTTGSTSASGGAGLAARTQNIPTASGHREGYVVFGANGLSAASISAHATEAWSVSAQGTQLRLQVTANGATARATALTLDQDKTAVFAAKAFVPDLQINTATPAVAGYVWTASDTSGNGSWQAPSATAGDATTSSKGIVQLAGDLGGTAASPTTPTAVHITGAETVAGAKTFTSGLAVNALTASGPQLLAKDTTLTSSASGGGGLNAGLFSIIPTASGHRLGYVVFSANNLSSASMAAHATEAWGGSAQGTEIRLQTTPNGSTTRATAVTIGQDKSVTIVGAVTASNLSGTNTGDQTSVTGNAGTATALQTARTINGVSFNGTANITITDDTKLAVASNLSDLASASTARSNLGLGTLATLSAVDLASNVGSTILPIANGGTGSATQNFVDLSTAQTIAGAKSFTSGMNITASLTAGTQFTVVDSNTSGVSSSGGGVSLRLAAIPTATNHRLGFLFFGANAINTSGITANSTETWSGSAQGTELRFYTTPNTSTTRTLAMTLGQDKTLTLVGNITPTTTGTLSVGTSSLPFGTVYTNALQIPTGAASGKVLMSDGSGNATWQSVSGTGDMLAATYDPASIAQQVVGTTATQTVSNKTFSGLTMADGTNIVLNTTTGTQIGTSSSQKIAVLGATPVAQQTATTDLGTVLSAFGWRASGTAYPLTTSGTITSNGTLAMNGKVSKAVVSKTSNTTTTASDNNIFCNATSGNITATLPAAASNTGVELCYIKTDASANTVAFAASGGSVLGGTTLASQYDSIVFISNGTDWYRKSFN